MIRIDLESWTEGQLREQAGRRGLSPESYAGMILETFIRTGLDPAGQRAPLYLTAADDEWDSATEGWIDPRESPGPIPDESLRREHMYEDRS